MFRASIPKHLRKTSKRRQSLSDIRKNSYCNNNLRNRMYYLAITLSQNTKKMKKLRSMKYILTKMKTSPKTLDITTLGPNRSIKKLTKEITSIDFISIMPNLRLGRRKNPNKKIKKIKMGQQGAKTILIKITTKKQMKILV